MCRWRCQTDEVNSSSVRAGRPIPSARRYLGAILVTVVIGSVLAVGLAGGALSGILTSAENDVDRYLEDSVLDELSRSARQQAASFEIEFEHAQDDVEQIRDETLHILENPAPVDPSEADRYVLTPEGSYITRVVDDGAAMYYSAINEIGPAQREKALQFSRLDPLLRYVTVANHLVAQAYVNTYDTLLRLYPNFPVGEVFPPDTDVRDFNFFYLADAENNPERNTVWTPVYVDPVGQGWITSVISPVYSTERLEAVAALDIRVQQLVDDILDVPQPFGGSTLLIDADGVIIAMPQQMETILNLDELTDADYSEYISSDLYKSDDFDIDTRPDTGELAAALDEAEGVQRLTIGDAEAFVAWDTLDSTGWRVVSVTPTSGVAEIYAPGERTSDATRLAFAVMVGALVVVLASIFIWLFSTMRRITNQFVAIDRATARIADGDFHPTLPSAPIAEMESTGEKILQMGSRLNRAQAELRERADQLRANEQRYRAIFANVAEAVLTVGADGVIVDANDAAVALFSGALEGRPARAALHTDSWSEPGRHVLELAAPWGEPRVLEFNVTATAMEENDPDRLGFTISIRDLTSEVEAQRLLEDAREDAERTARLKDSLLSSMSHEIRTPMNGVIGILSLMADGELPPTARQQLDVARRSAEDLLVLLNDVLDLAKLDAEQVSFNPRSVRLTDLVRGVVQLHQPLADEQGDVVLVDIARDLPEWIVIDPTRVRQVLMNLLNNALKFTREGSVTLRLHATATSGDAFTLRCEVADTGTGIAPDMQSLLFQPFTQVDPLDARKYPGTGLGLAIVKRLVELMGGEVGLHSAIGAGSVFWFTVPAVRGEAVVDDLARQPMSAEGGSLRVLVAEDNEVNRMVLVRMLERLGHTSVEAVNGRQAIEVAQTDVFDVVLMDVQMPVASGIDATRAIRALGGRHAQVPILAVSANAMPEQQEQYVQSGMTAALAKPITLEQLDAALRRWVPRTAASTAPTPAAGTSAAPETSAVHVESPAAEQPVTPADEGTPLLDLAAIRELRSTLGEAGSTKMRELFPASLAQRRSEMAAALDRGDHDAARKAAHSVKGMAGSMGARALQHLAEQMQHADDATFDGLVGSFEQLADQTLAVFDSAWTD